MKKVLTMLVVGAVVATASADLTSFGYTGGKLFDAGGGAFSAGTYVDGAVIYMTDLNPFVVDNGGQLQIDLADIVAAYGMLNIAVGPAFAGGKYSTPNLAEQPSSVIGQIAYLVFDANGGGIQEGDFIGIAAAGNELVDLKPDANPAAAPQSFNPGDITSNVQVIAIPEPATFGLMGIAGLGLFLARKKARR